MMTTPHNQLCEARKEIAELETKNQSIAQYAMRDLRNAGLELAAAKAEIEDAWACDEKTGNLLRQANARIKELEASRLLALQSLTGFADERDQLKEREQKLLAALEKILSLPTTGVETKIAREALKAHRGEGE